MKKIKYLLILSCFLFLFSLFMSIEFLLTPRQMRGGLVGRLDSLDKKLNDRMSNVESKVKSIDDFLKITLDKCQNDDKI